MAAAAEPLTLNGDKRAITASGQIGVVMRLGRDAVDADGNKFKFFEYAPAFYGPKVRIEWEGDTMLTVLPAATAELLIKNNYARVMNGAEVRAYNRELGKPKEGEPS